MLSLYIYLTVLAVSVGQTFASPLERRAISADLLTRFNLAEQYAAAAYCPLNNNSPGSKITCSVGNCPLVEAANTVSTAEFENSLITDVTGYVAIDYTNSLIVVAFRGSQSVRNYLTDANFPAVPTDICDGCTAFAGFYNSWKEARTEVLAKVDAAIAANPSFTVACVGHSLGGAIATFAAAELRKEGHPTLLYSFGAPRIAGPKLSTFITNQGNNYRITHDDDPVPRLPPIFLGYVHISPEYWITSGNDVPVTTNDVKGPITGAINFSGNTGTSAFDLPAHGWYFNKISSCNPGGKLEIRD